MVCINQVLISYSGLIGKSHCEINPMDWAHVTDFLLQVNPDSIYSKRKRTAQPLFPSFQDIIDATGILNSYQL